MTVPKRILTPARLAIVLLFAIGFISLAGACTRASQPGSRLSSSVEAALTEPLTSPPATTSVTPTRASEPIQAPTITAPPIPASVRSPEPSAKATEKPTPTQSLPARTSDLLFVSDGALKRWDYVTSYTGVLVSDVVDFNIYNGYHASTNSEANDGRRVALLRTRNISANGVELFDLALLDFDSMQTTTLLESIPRPAQFGLSPDGDWLAYISLEEALVYALRTDASGQRIELGNCQPGEDQTCKEIAWSPDSKSLLWSDAQGVWLSKLDQSGPRLVYPNRVIVSDPKGKTMEITVTFHAFIWSPGGRYVLAEVLPNESGVRWRGVLDTRRTRLVEVPGSYDAVQPKTNVIWLQDGSLLAIHTSEVPDERLLYVKHWRLVDTRDDLLSAQAQVEIQSDNLPESNGNHGATPSLCVNWLAQDGSQEGIKFLLGVAPSSEQDSPILFRLDLDDGSLQKLYEIPPGSTEVHWSPDGGGAIVLGKASQVLFAPLHGVSLRDLRPLLGEQAYGFIWLAPMPRE